MKKFLCITIALAMLLAFASCAGSGDNNASQDGTSENEISIISDSVKDDSSATSTSSEDDIGSQSSQPEIDSRSLVDVFNAVSNNDILNSDTVMAQILKFYFEGQEDILYFRNFSSGNSKLFDLALDDLSAIDSAICVEPLEGPIEYCCYLIKLKDGANAEDVKAKVLSAMDKSRWECVTAEKAVVIDSGSFVLALMASEAETDAYIKAFKEVMGSAGTVLSK